MSRPMTASINASSRLGNTRNRPASTNSRRSYFSDPARARRNAGEMGVYRQSINSTAGATRERKGTKNYRTPPKTGEKTGDDSPSVRGARDDDARPHVLPRWRSAPGLS